MPTPVPHPFRVRVFGGRAVHAARELDSGRATACDYYLPAGATNHWLDDTTPITCGRCTRNTEPPDHHRGVPMPETSRYAFVPPAIEGVSVGALDSATDGANMLGVYAATPAGRNVLAHALVQLARDGWLRVSPDPAGAWEPLSQRADRPPSAPETLAAP